MKRKNPAAVALRSKGRKSRARKLTEHQRRVIAREGGLARARNAREESEGAGRSLSLWQREWPRCGCCGTDLVAAGSGAAP
jgi:hypothetical protein